MKKAYRIIGFENFNFDLRYPLKLTQWHNRQYLIGQLCGLWTQTQFYRDKKFYAKISFEFRNLNFLLVSQSLLGQNRANSMYDEIDMCQRSINHSVQTHLDAVVYGALIRGRNDIKSGIDSALTTGKI